VLEGVAFGLRDCFALLARVGLGAMARVRISGGGARSPLWREIVASTLALPLETVAADEGAAYGAALLAGVGAGAWADVATACAAAIQPGEVTAPNPDWQATYERLYPVYQSLYPALRPAFTALAAD
jgi:xylulokinase